MSFRFTLATVLRVRESIERREELALQRAEYEVARVQRQVEELSNKLAKDARDREQALQQPTQAFRLRSMQAEMDADMATRQALLDILQTLQQKRDAQMKRYQIAHNDHQVLIELQKQQKGEYEHEQERAQQKRLDDLFAARLHLRS
ncbi:MAG: hypothetical protein WBV28_18645 [Terracidiphilus sp.]